MRKFITADDVERHAREGGGPFFYGPKDVLTDVAKETAYRLGISLVLQESASVAASPSKSTPESRSPSNVIRLGTSAVSEGTAFGSVMPTATSSPFSDGEMKRWRSEFPCLKDFVHVANCSQGAQSTRVSEAVQGYMNSWNSSGMDWDFWVEEVDKAKTVFARLVNCSQSDVGVVGSLSEAVSTVASALDYAGKRRQILLSEAEFPTVGHVWLAHEKYGADVKFVPLTGDEIVLSDYERASGDETLMASITHVYYQTGFKQDLKRITDIIHSKGGLVFVDAYQGLGSCPLDVQELGVDMLASGNLKYLLGVPGIAFVYMRPEIVSRMRPAETGWFGQENPFSFDLKALDYAKSGRRVEGGTPPVTAAFAARAGMELILDVGLERIGQQIDFLSAYCLSGALERGMEVMSPLDVSKKGATTAIRVPGNSHDIEVAMRKRNIVTSARGPAIRIAPHFFCTAEDIDTTLDQLQLILARERR